MKKMNALLLFQGIYYLLTGIWPIIHIESFMYVTGPKTDIWLVKMVGLLAASIGITLLSMINSKARSMVLSVSTALSFLLIDTYYALNGRISMIYMADAAVELLFLILILILSRNNHH